MEVLTLKPSTKKQGRWLLHLSDGTILRVGEAELVQFSLYSGMELSQEDCEEIQCAVGLRQGKEKGLALLTARPLSRKELIEKLTAQPRDKEKSPTCTVDVAEQVAHRLEELGYLNDQTYAATLVGHYGKKGYGQGRIRQELYRHGVPRDLWDEALQEAISPDHAIDSYLVKKLKGQVPDQKERKRVTDGLARRGFSWGDIDSGFQRYLEGLEGSCWQEEHWDV